MIKHIFISSLFIVGFFALPSSAQNAAQATMRVSVTVVSSSAINVEKPEIVLLFENEKSDLGTVNFQGFEKGDVFINNDNEIVLTDKNGNEVTMNIQRNNINDAKSIQFKGKSEGLMMSSVYTGELNTSVEYF